MQGSEGSVVGSQSFGTLCILMHSIAHQGSNIMRIKCLLCGEEMSHERMEDHEGKHKRRGYDEVRFRRLK